MPSEHARPPRASETSEPAFHWPRPIVITAGPRERASHRLSLNSVSRWDPSLSAPDRLVHRSPPP